MPTPNTLYYGDNLDILRRYVPDGLGAKSSAHRLQGIGSEIGPGQSADGEAKLGKALVLALVPCCGLRERVPVFAVGVQHEATRRDVGVGDRSGIDDRVLGEVLYAEVFQAFVEGDLNRRRWPHALMGQVVDGAARVRAKPPALGVARRDRTLSATHLAFDHRARLLEIAGGLGCMTTHGQAPKQPSITVLLEDIAAGRLVVRRASGRPKARPATASDRVRAEMERDPAATLAEVARRVGCSVSLVSKIKSGQRPA